MIREIHVKDLQVGMYVHELGVRWMNHPFLRNRFRISRQSEIEKIRACGVATVRIDTLRGLDVPIRPEPSGKDFVQEVAASKPSEELLPAKKAAERMREDTAQCARIYRETLPVVRQLMQEVRSGGKVDAHRVSQQVEQLVESAIRNPSAAVAMANLKGHDEYTFAHSIQVSILSVALGTQIGLGKDELTLLGTGAMLHDLGKASIPLKILNKPGRLTEEEFRVMKTHPQRGVSHLAEKGRGCRPEILSCILEHHEKLDGTGYPQGLTEPEIGLLPRIVSVADVYDALTSDRVYQKGTPAHNAIVILYGLRNVHFDPQILNAFIGVVGVYPVGTMVRLNTREIAVVVSVNPREPLRPDIEILTDRDQKPLARARFVRLSEEEGPRGSVRRNIAGPWISPDAERLLRATGSSFRDAIPA
jgi:HD-GYP domain-containing protein (c-di-GMP phosphodiesterase class II)